MEPGLSSWAGFLTRINPGQKSPKMDYGMQGRLLRMKLRAATAGSNILRKWVWTAHRP